MCQINPSSPYNFAPESEAIARLREQLSLDAQSSSKKSESEEVITHPQLDAVKRLIERLSLGER